jgi:hypothetical protein
MATDEQLEKLKLMYENGRSHYEEATFRRPARVTDRGFRWAAIYIAALAFLPSYLQVTIESLLNDWKEGLIVLALLKSMCSLASLLGFYFAIRSLADALRYRDYSWVNPEAVSEISGNLSLERFYGAMIERFISACLDNITNTQDASRYLANSNRWFYRALFLGITVYLICKLQNINI